MALHHSFSGKRVLVTGGASGIGRQLVQRFYDDGAIVFTIDKNPDAVQELKKALPKVTAEVVDVTDWDATKKVVESFGVIDHLVNNAGIVIYQTFMNITKEAALAQLNVNFVGMINISQIVARGLIAAGRGGSIVNVASMTARVGTTTVALYGATKAAVENLTKSMAMDLGPHNIRVNAISPGIVDTPMVQDGASRNSAMLDVLKKRLVIKRLITPDEITDSVMFLLSPLSTMIVGETLLIDAGLMTQ